ncbi:DUF3192 domain-containing protein [Pseudoalteromonas sp.]|uniref:DUF3192 domain-containing protein n=1 Tax=Pseudoalteromonas sp. TaxID=53249 RepID=UPI0035645E38
MKYLVLASVLTLPLLTGCVVAVGGDGKTSHTSSWERTHEKNRKAISNMELGKEYQQVINKLGTPSFSELVKQGDTEFRVLYYATNSVHSDGKTTKDECTPLVFKNNQLTGWGENALNQLKN